MIYVNLVTIGFMASEKMPFENVDDGRWMDDGCLGILQAHLSPRAGLGVERIGGTPPPLAQSVETWPIGVRLVCRELRPASLEERILVIERVGCGRYATHYFGLNFS